MVRAICALSRCARPLRKQIALAMPGSSLNDHIGRSQGTLGQAKLCFFFYHSRVLSERPHWSFTGDPGASKTMVFFIPFQGPL